MEIKVNWEVNITSGSETIRLEELGIDSLDTWESMTDGYKEEIIQDYLDELPERVNIVVDTWR